MDWLSLPPLAALRAFSAFAEHANVSKAGAALNVSHAAISQQLRSLEDHLGVPLLDRSGRSLELTEEGKHLAQAVLLGFGAIQTAVQEVSTQGAMRPLHISCTPMFAANWLMPRLAEFRLKHPGIDLVIDPRGEVVALQPGGVDIALRYGDGDWGGLESEILLCSPMVVVAHPDLLKGRSVSAPEDLLDFPWLEELGTTEAAHWLRSRGVADVIRGASIKLPGNLLMQAVREGQGIAVSVKDFVQEDLAAGRLVELFTGDEARGYHIVTRPGVQRPQSRQFIAWLRHHKSTYTSEREA
ncbi:LysR substrate-binding domain-containing protein [Pseudophaeobacter sp.]|uniref:LysR substrate-binding domain-containing protein n=1 Tax=Pseudophaeobacter sp. TaxID=1971739 RepID=UPI00329783C6